MARDDGDQGGRAEIGGGGLEHGAVACEAATGPVWWQWLASIVLIAGFGAAVFIDLRLALSILHSALLVAFTAAVIWRAVAVVIARPPGRIRRLAAADLPPYTVIVPLYREAEMVPGLTGALSALDYPKDRLQILIVLEADDTQTLFALKRTEAAGGFQVIVAPPGAPKTKPRACNIALAEATGCCVVVYDAEDRPHRLQLQEAAARFAKSSPDLVCLQAPLRIAGAGCFLARQFALEYAAQFEVILPALARLGAPFPLGGTSNHFRTSALRALGGWDAWNVTEDADLGFRIAGRRLRTGLLRCPTWESAPAHLRDWLPQRTRWVKGYMQTWGVHMRAPFKGGVVPFIALQATLGLAIASAVIHGPLLLMIAIYGGAALIANGAAPPAADLALLVGGWGGAILAMSTGAQRAGLRMRWREALAAPIYWGLQSVAAVLAGIQLCTRPHYWNKTSHAPPLDRRIGGALYAATLDGKGAASVRRAA
jgi:cellulose synthase/poly-beta-1,6-N-acetylglucosamine synthase-like glycosyltransferase